MAVANHNGRTTPAIAGISYAFPAGLRSVGELAGEQLLSSSAETMESFGFGNVHVALTESPYDLALAAATQLLAETGIDRQSVGLLIYGGTPGSMSFAPAENAERAAAGLCTMSRFKYPASRLQYDLDVSRNACDRRAWVGRGSGGCRHPAAASCAG